MKLTDLPISRNMVISSMRLPLKVMHKATWISPNGQTKNQIDLVLIDA
jgi:hypothetical protein